MINNERVKHMTRMAIYDKEMYSKYQPMLQYIKKDYVAIHGWGGFLAGTIAFAFVYILAVLYIISSVFEKVNTFIILLIILVGLILYGTYIVFHVHRVRKRAAKRYKKGKRCQREVRRQYEQLLEMYKKENEEKIPEVIRNTTKIQLDDI